MKGDSSGKIAAPFLENSLRHSRAIGSGADVLCSRAGDCSVWGFPFMEDPSRQPRAERPDQYMAPIRLIDRA